VSDWLKTLGKDKGEESPTMKVVWSRMAIRHLTALREHIAKDPEQNAALVARRILHSVELLETQPYMGRPGRVVGTRELVVPNTPYLIPYRVRRERLELIAVFHGHRQWPTKL
jgi:toxin ParE1/3/4